jgi:hypothetical protein
VPLRSPRTDTTHAARAPVYVVSIPRAQVVLVQERRSVLYRQDVTNLGSHGEPVIRISEKFKLYIIKGKAIPVHN